MKFLIDNALSPIVSSGLNELGYDAIHVRDLNMATAADTGIFNLAAQQDRILISADTDFGALLALRDAAKPSFILFRQADKRPASQLTLLETHLSSLEKDLLEGSIVVFEDERIRIRPLPISKV